jgi:ubiquinone/menaquinone biosynthesis C-methylase UbiE
MEFLDVHPGERLLDIGCGNGVAAKLMAEKAVDGFVAGIDYSQVSVSIATKRNADAIEAGKVQISLGDAIDLPYEDVFFDKVCSLESFYFWSDYLAGLREAKRVLKANGQIFIVMELVKDESRPEKNIKLAQSMDCPIFSGREVADMLEQAGFRQPVYEMKPGKEWVCIQAIR